MKKQKIQQLAEHLGIQNYNIDLIDLSRMQLEKDSSGKIQIKYLKNNGDWAYLTNRKTGSFRADSSLYDSLSGSQGVKNFLVTDEESARLKRTKAAARKLNDSLPTTQEFEDIPLLNLGNKVADIQVNIHEAQKQTNFNPRELVSS